MAMEHIYFDHDIERPVELKKFKGFSYQYEKWSRDEGTVEIFDHHGEQVASFQVKPDTCYVLQRRNQSALQLHEVTPPRVFRDRAAWLFGFGSKQRCDSWEKLCQAGQAYQEAHPNSKLLTSSVSSYGSYLTYVYAAGDYVTPVAYYCEWADNEAWAFVGDDTICEVIATMHRDLNFRYPLQFVIHQVKAMASLYPVGARNFFQGRLGIYDEDAYYADEYGGF